MHTDAVLRYERPVRVVVADDHPSYLYALGEMLSAHGQLEVVGQAADGGSALELIAELAPDVAVIDLKMSPIDGFEVCRALSQDGEDGPTAVILISAYEDPELVARGRSCGASGYLSKEASNDAICCAVLAVAHGLTSFARA